MCLSGCHSHPPIVSKSYCLTAGNPPTLYDCIDLAQRGGGFAGRIQISDLQAGNTAVYPHGFFERYSPRTALDIVSRVPGFVIDFGSDRRGFDDTGGNVLIDGERAQSKSGGLSEALERIPANRVERIELVTNPTMAVASGKTLIANVVLRPAESAGSWQLSQTRARDGSISPWLNGSYARPLGAWQTSSTIEAGVYRDPNVGSRERSDRSGAVTLREDERRANRFGKTSISFEAKRPSEDGGITVNARFSGDEYEADTLRAGFAGADSDAPAIQTRTSGFLEENRDAEFGVTYRRSILADWRLEALTLARWTEREETSQNLIETPDGMFVSGARSLARRENLEWIARPVITAPEWAGWRPEFGGELVYNRMDANLDLLLLSAGGVATPLVLPSANVIVDEWRAETFLNVSRTVMRDWTIDAGISLESSNIAVRGGAQASQQLAFIKPSVAVAWKPSDQLSIRGALRREAGQLDFHDFAASAELGADRTLGGNPALQPDTSTRLSFDVDYRVGNDVAVSFEMFHEWRQDVSEPIVLPSGDFGVGNAGDARVWGASLRASRSLPFGLRADARAVWQDASYRDAISGSVRPVSGFVPLTFGVELRQDFPGKALAWGARLSKEGVDEEYFVDERQSFDFGYQQSVYVETALPWGLKATLTVSELGQRQFTLRRSLFTPTRGGIQSGTEWRRFARGPDVTLAIERNF
jgi:hypothetical protein